MTKRHLILVLALAGAAFPLSAQWTNRYQRIGQGHHVYVEGYDFPTYSAGPTYPAVSPDGTTLAFSARGWLWTMPAAGGAAQRLTNTAGLDSRAAWHPDGTRLAFVRDDTRNTDIVEIDLATGRETVLVSSPAAELDPAYAPDGAALYYASAESGDLEIYRMNLASREKARVTNTRGLDLRPQPLADGSLVYVSKRGNGDEVAVLGPDGTRRVVALASIASLARPAVSRDGRTIAVPLPIASRTEFALQLIDVRGGPMTEIRTADAHPAMPAWDSARGIYYSQADDRGVFALWHVDASGDAPRKLAPTTWDWRTPTIEVVVRTRTDGQQEDVPARVAVVDSNGHPAFPDGQQAWLDSQNGHVFAYSNGTLRFTVPAGRYTMRASRGFEYLPVSREIDLKPADPGARVVVVPLDLPRVGGPSMDGMYSGDNHFHLNYGGQVLLEPPALVAMLQGEDLDVAAPLSANLHTRRIDDEYFAWSRAEPPLIQFGQEVRSHFLGHTGHIGVKTLFWPWYWGPGYPVYDRDDRSNVSALRATRQQGGVNSYVHPVSNRGPFDGESPRGIPLELVSDAVLGDVDTIDVACLWTDELGTSDVWYRLLSVGAVVTPSAGSDAMVDFFRTMAVGSTRVYVKIPGALSMRGYLEALKAGRSFVTTAPLLAFKVGGAEAGDAVKTNEGQDMPWELAVGSSVPYERVEIVVNGEIAWSGAGLKQAGAQTYRGTIKAPSGGWIAARVHGGAAEWPVMDSYPFAHTAPIWFGSPGSTEPAAAARASRDLLAALDVAERRIKQSYEGTDTPVLLGRIRAAREKLGLVSQ